MNYNLVEMRKRFLAMMSIHYGFMRPEDVNLEAIFSADGLKAIQGKSFSATDALLATMSAAITKFTAAHAQSQLFIAFGDTISEAKSPRAVAVIPTTFLCEASAIAENMRYPLAVKFDVENIVITFSEAANIACFSAKALGVTVEMGKLAMDAVIKDIASNRIFATIGSGLNLNAVVVPNSEYRLEIDVESILSVEAELIIDNQKRFGAYINEQLETSAEISLKTLPKIILGDLQAVIGMTASMYCEKEAHLYDYALQTLNNTVGTLAELEYITL